MHVYKSRTLVRIWTPAKLNLFLEILGRRSDGYHEIETAMVPIDIFDTLVAEATSDAKIKLHCEIANQQESSTAVDGPSYVDLPNTEDNLVYQAFRLIQKESGSARGVRVRLTKRIPSMAGLGGGSSDAAAALLMANELWQLDYSVNQLAEFASRLGSDIPFFLYRCHGICRGRGELMETIQPKGPHHFVVVRPPLGISTPAVFKNSSLPSSPKSVEPIKRSLQHGSTKQLANGLFNRLQPSAQEISTQIQDLAARFKELDFLGHQMSGSGSSYFGLCRNRVHATRIASKLRSQRIGQVFAVRTIQSPCSTLVAPAFN